MFKVLANAFKVKDIRDKLIYVLLVLLVYRIGTTIPLPGINLDALYYLQGMGGDPTFFMMMMGGGYGTLMAMGIMPYITASIIMQLLTVAIPKLEQIQKEGEEGRKRINQYTRRFAVVLAFLQGSAMVSSYVNNPWGIQLFNIPNMLTYVMAVVGMVSGTIFIMWLAELLTERGIGNGASFIIFANILSSLPMAIQGLIYLLDPNALTMGIIRLVAVIVIFALVIAFVVMVAEGERRIPVQYSKKMAGRMFNNSYIPIKVNIAGVMSIIFSISLLQFPAQLSQFFPFNETLQTISFYLGLNHWVGVSVYVVLIFLFTFFYTSFSINTVEMSQNMKANGGFIPGIRPGKPTGDFVQTVVDRMSWIGAVCYSLIAITPVIFEQITGIAAGFGGTTLLIATGVALEFIKQLESQLLMRHYKGFLS